MRRLLWALGLLLAVSTPSYAQVNCITVNGIQQCSGPLRLFDTTSRQALQPVLDLTQTWNGSGVIMSGIRLNITDTNSSASSLLLDLQVGGTSKFNVTKSGAVTMVGALTPGSISVPNGTNPEAGQIAWSSNQLMIGGVNNGGTSRNTVITAGANLIFAPNNGISEWQVTSAGNLSAVAGSTPVVPTAPTDSTVVLVGDMNRLRSSSTITPASGGVGNCGAAFAAAALTADCTIATLPAGMKLVAIYADVTVGFTCSGTCTGTKVMQAGTAAGGTQVFAAGANVATTGQFGLADADLGSGMTRAAAIQGGLIGSWSGTTPISVRFTSGTGNWGTGAATNVNAGSIKFTLITEQVK